MNTDKQLFKEYADIHNFMYPQPLKKWIDETNFINHYSDDWDWLMPVVEQIENLGYEFIIAESRCKINHNTDHSIEEVVSIDIIGSKIEATYNAVVEFINQNNN
jgi:hypothetical protein